MESSGCGLQKDYASGQTFVLRTRATVLKRSKRTVYTVFLATKVLVDQLSCIADAGIFPLAFNASTPAKDFIKRNGNHTDDVTMVPWETGKQPVLEVTVADAFTPSRINNHRG